MIDGERLPIAKLDHRERRRVLIDTPDGLEPAALWLNRYGLPSLPSAWQEMFKIANQRCGRLGMKLRCHAHVLRHSFAVVTLEQLWRGHIQELAAMTPRQRETYQSGRNAARTTSATNQDLSAFHDWINDYCRHTGHGDNIPPVNRQEWRVTTSQFRRTLAWFIARRPGGVIAGALQYGHLRVQMFEGYAGSSDSGFRDEVEAEEAIARGEKLGDLITSDEFHRLRGPAAAEAESRLVAFERHAQFQGKVINDRKRLQRHMNRHDPHVYPGQYVTCVHNPDRALCRRSDGREGPLLTDCQPLRCRNVALSTTNIARLQTAVADLDQELIHGDRLAPFVRHRLLTRRQELTDFLTEITVADPDTATETA